MLAVDLDIVPFGEHAQVIGAGILAITRQRDAKVFESGCWEAARVALVEDDGIYPALNLGHPSRVGIEMIVERFDDQAPFRKFIGES